MSKIYWTGRSTNGLWKRSESVDSFSELYEKCIDNDTISIYDYNPYDALLLEKNGKTEDDFLDVNGDYDYSLYQKWLFSDECKFKDLTDIEIKQLIREQDGNAYYQTFQYYDNDLEDYVDIDDSCFDENGNYIK